MGARHSHDARCSCGNLRESLVITVMCRRTNENSRDDARTAGPGFFSSEVVQNQHTRCGRAIVDECRSS
jgi:hypothetical protein